MTSRFWACDFRILKGGSHDFLIQKVSASTALQKLKVRLWPCKPGLNPPVIFYVTDRSKVVLLWWFFLFYVLLFKMFCAVGALCMFSYFS